MNLIYENNAVELLNVYHGLADIKWQDAEENDCSAVNVPIEEIFINREEDYGK